MGAVSYISGSDEYKINPITDYTSIDKDYNTVQDEVQDVSEEWYKDNMKLSVDQGLAFTIVKNNEQVGFVYNIIMEDKYYGASINIWDNVGTLIGLRNMFDMCDKEYIEFVPHISNLKYFKSMIVGATIREYHGGLRSSVIIRKEDIYEKGRKLFKYLGIENG